MQFFFFTVLICVTQIIHTSFACEGFNVKLVSFSNGINNPSIDVQLFHPKPEIRLDDKCQLYVSGCVNIKKKIDSAVLSFVARKEDLKATKKKDIDLCELLEKSHYHKGCGKVTPGRTCDQFPVNLKKYKKYIESASKGIYKVAAEVLINGKDKNTYDLVLEFYK